MTKVTASNWMEGVDDSTTLDRTSIPGTHDSCALYDKATGGDTQCQWLSITKQLEQGIRYLDIRCKYVADDDPTLFFPIHHGNMYQNIKFSQVQTECIEFLKLHPTEFIMMCIQQEEHWYASDNHYLLDGKTFSDKFQTLADMAWWRLWGQPEIPDVGRCRKHIVLVRTYDAKEPKGWQLGQGQGLGLEWNGFNINDTSSNDRFETQNGWSKWYGTEKGQKVEAYLDLAAKQAPGPKAKIYLNFLSHTDGRPGNNAKDMNPMIRDYVKNIDFRKPLGVLPMDFTSNTGQPGSGCLEDVIIEHNPYKPGSEYY